MLKLSKYSPPRFTAGNLLLEVTSLNGENALRVQLEILFKNGKTDQDSMNLVKQKDGWKIKL